MILAAVTLWYFLVSDVAGTGRPDKLAGYQDPMMCERMAQFTRKTMFNSIVHVLARREIRVDDKVIGHVERHCFPETLEAGRAPVVVIQQR